MDIRTAIISISDTRTLENDRSGDKLAELAAAMGMIVAERAMATDDLQPLSELIAGLCDRGGVDLILTTGGTGLGTRDNTPEATLAVVEREVPGLSEAMRRETALKTPFAMISRGVCGVRGSTLIINLPGSTKAVEECLQVIAPVLSHAVSLIRGESVH
ncbi:MAG: MogA/MoaB family molybdenum cofactor biosynthesis protein [Chloracidobacterium sp.]|nr:MogA/MoaB family molybdenum cofactor biosynthesis protein [Chloracidobacterium sp.]MCC6826445.1 MogA/MoaB family molybdenum cofactor biosynthesis protein [Acidobacteriota bacterium]MCO5334074.1 MogA/MoaB family molybdenum cofactor biosynthesis protein [Pyrinomonadaceae bacterium]